MCSISGSMSSIPLDDQKIHKTLLIHQKLKHRGPDGEGIFKSPNVILQHNRLSIIGIDDGHQPIKRIDHSQVLIANGEIYNHLEIRQRLESDFEYTTHSDCESILALYSQYGIQGISQIRGMFAFALYDKLKKKVYLGRDRLGEKPLYYSLIDGVLYFSSELRSLANPLSNHLTLDLKELENYFLYQYIPEPATPFTEVKKLPPSHILEFDLITGRFSIVEYWDFNPSSTQCAYEKITDSLDDAFSFVVRSDVPIAVALSGGLDSSTAALFALRHSEQDVTAVTVGYDGNHSCDETQDAREFANHLGLRFISTKITTSDIIRDFKHVTLGKDDIIADISGYGYEKVARICRENGIRVLLHGQGIDELYWGYEWHRSAALESVRKLNANHYSLVTLNSILRLLKERYTNIRTFLSAMYRGYLVYEIGQIINRCNQKIPTLTFYDNVSDYQFTRSKFSSRSIKVSEKWGTIGERSTGDILTHLIKLVCRYYLLSNGIAQADRLSMLNGVESRLPFLDHFFVEYSIQNSARKKELYHRPKQGFREGVADLLPESVLKRPKKGFTPPTFLWKTEIIKHNQKMFKDSFILDNSLISENLIKKSLKTPKGHELELLYKFIVLETWIRGTL